MTASATFHPGIQVNAPIAAQRLKQSMHRAATALAAFGKALGRAKSWHADTYTPSDLHYGVREFLIDSGQVPYDANDDAPLLFNATYLDNDRYAQGVTIVDETTALCTVHSTHDYTPLPDPCESGELRACWAFDLADPNWLDELFAWVQWCHPQHSTIGQRLPAFYHANQALEGLRRDGLKVPDGTGQARFRFTDESFAAYDWAFDAIHFDLIAKERELSLSPRRYRVSLSWPSKAIAGSHWPERLRADLVRRLGF